MGLSRKQFDILRELATSGTALTQRDLEKATGYSLGTINKTVKELTDLGCMANGAINGNGIEALEPYRAKRAIFIAARLWLENGTYHPEHSQAACACSRQEDN